MAKKQKKKTELKRPPTKRQLSKWQRQQRIQRITMVVGIIFFVLIAAYIGYGYYGEQFKPLRQSAVRVDDAVFNMDYYIKMLDLISQGQQSDMVSAMVDMVAEFIAEGELIRQRAADLGANVSAMEIDDEIANLQMPNDKVYRDFVATKLLAAKLLRDYFDPKVPMTCEQVKVQAMLLESQEVAGEVRDRLEAGDDFATVAEKSSKEAVTKEKKGDLGWLPKGYVDMLFGDLANSRLEDIAFSLEPGMLSEPTYDDSVTKGIGYWILEVTEKDPKKGSYVRVILLGSWEKAAEIQAKLEAGEDFVALAKEYSQHVRSSEQGGDLGWTQGEILNRTVVAFAEQLEPGTISKPVIDESVQTRGGYWLIKVEDRDANRQLEDEVRETLKMQLFGDWVNGLKAESLIENYLTPEEKAWAVDRALRGREQ